MPAHQPNIRLQALLGRQATPSGHAHSASRLVRPLLHGGRLPTRLLLVRLRLRSAGRESGALPHSTGRLRQRVGGSPANCSEAWRGSVAGSKHHLLADKQAAQPHASSPGTQRVVIYGQLRQHCERVCRSPLRWKRASQSVAVQVPGTATGRQNADA